MGEKCCRESDVDKLTHTVYGNGNPERSLIVRVANQEHRTKRIDSRVGRIEKLLWAVAAMVLLAVFQQFVGMIKLDQATVVVPTPATTMEATP